MNLFEKEAFVTKAAEEFENQSPEAILKLGCRNISKLNTCL